jgi:hypothetical protein
MRGALRRFFVALVALAFLGGTLERSALGFTPTDPCPSSGRTMAHEPLQAGDEHYGHHATDKRQEPSKDPGTKCFCYGMAGFNVASASASDIAFHATPISFSISLKTYTGRSIILDPGIPKRIA